MSRQRSLLLLAAALVAIGLLTVAPWLAITAPVGARTLMVEGWIPTYHLPAIVRLAVARDIEQVFVTGGERPLARYLIAGDTLVASGDLGGPWRLELAGLPGVHWELRADGKPVRTGTIDRGTQPVDVVLPHATARWSLNARRSGPPVDSTALLFVRSVAHAERGPAAAGHTLQVCNARGATLPCDLTWAGHRAQQLVALGLPADRVLAVPGLADARGRTVASADAMAQQARWAGVGAYELVSLGVHARRSWKAHLRANEGTVLVGVIALNDPRVPPRTWWLHVHAWPVVAKELAGLMRAALVGTFGT